MTISEQIKILCVRCNVSEAELARRLGKSPQSFNAKMKRESFTIDDLNEIADAVGVEFKKEFYINEWRRNIMKSKEVKEFRLGELFCGPGGLAYAAVNSQIEDSEYKIIHKWSNDYDLDTCKTYTRNICPNDPESVICGDVRKLDIEPLGDIDALAFGFPCNDFSVVGEQKGFNGTFGPLYSYGIKVVKKI